ncbi:GIY-YIG nuclease family protein [Falsirhodobacter xinxiangensis]|uniref:GIY-YIG nuclease family protein n=1 Tax=Falsirhodobacter xinxiangensis TaxID=2530049 RepID=UPI0010AB41FC|nr:GIY-YIG nuclease family protein [Rhodobacter xinxiangensis]
MNHGRSLELFFVDGKPAGIVTAEVFNWTGHVLRIPRTEIAKGLRREQASYAGVYLLLGEQDGQPCAYVGEGEDVASRIKSHDQSRDWWDEVVIVTTLSNNLHKAHIKYLESRVVEKALTVGSTLQNGNTPPRSGLSEAARANMEEFLEMLDLVLAALGIGLMVDNKRRASATLSDDQPSAPLFELSRGGEIVAAADVIGDEFVVRKGSVAGNWNADSAHTYKKLHNELVVKGVVADGKFQISYAFKSASAAAAIVLGRAANGPRNWRRPDRTTYADWEAAQLGALQ